MTTLAWLLLLLPFSSSLVLLLLGSRFPRRAVNAVGVGSIACTSALAVSLLVLQAGAPALTTDTLAIWVDTPRFQSTFSLRLDALAVAMATMVTSSGTLIHWYAAAFMRDERGLVRFFTGMNLFVGFMLTLVLSGDLLMLYLGWEGVGLCSYLLIGFWHEKRENLRAARKAFVMTRFGDVALAIGLFVLASRFGTLDIGTILARTAARWPVGAPVAELVAGLFSVAAIAKSAQVPLHTWLPDAMAGPTPVSALIHAATMVTAGVYLVARLWSMFVLAPAILTLLAWVGLVTMLLAALAATRQRDIKRVLAYSTMSQVGYMFLALGVGACSAAMAHLFAHAAFKALLFLSAGVVIASTGGQHDLFELGGLRRRLPVAFWTFLIGSASLVGVPLVTAGFYTKDAIVAASWNAAAGTPWLGIGALLGVFLTAVYTTRVVVLTFWGKQHSIATPRRGPSWKVPLIILALSSCLGALLSLPGSFPASRLLAHWLAPSVPEGTEPGGALALTVSLASTLALGLGVGFAVLRLRRREFAFGSERIRRLLEAGFYFDALYAAVFTRPARYFAHALRSDWLDAWAQATGAGARLLHRALSHTQSGKLRSYASVLVGATALILAWVVWS